MSDKELAQLLKVLSSSGVHPHRLPAHLKLENVENCLDPAAAL